MRPLNFKSLSAADLSVDQSGSEISSAFVVEVSAQAVVTGTTPVGVVKLQASNDPLVATHWSDITGASVAVNAVGSFLIPKIDLSYEWVRAVWVATSGTGAVTVNLKTVGY